ncbi:MAG: hypothetical protein RL196_333 [Actinomycetota bacterium]|jgi:glucan phosphoethanolaminetransferase (alkaline phosphatase superfamily)
MVDALDTFANLDSGFYVFNVAWLAFTAFLIFHTTAMIYEEKRFSMVAVIVGPITILFTCIFPLIVFAFYATRHFFSDIFLCLCSLCVLVAWALSFGFSRYLHVSGRRARSEQNKKQFSVEIRARRASTWPFAALFDWDSIEREYQRNLADAEQNKRADKKDQNL